MTGILPLAGVVLGTGLARVVQMLAGLPFRVVNAVSMHGAYGYPSVMASEEAAHAENYFLREGGGWRNHSTDAVLRALVVTDYSVPMAQHG